MRLGPDYSRNIIHCELKHDMENGSLINGSACVLNTEINLQQDGLYSRSINNIDTISALLVYLPGICDFKFYYYNNGNNYPLYEPEEFAADLITIGLNDITNESLKAILLGNSNSFQRHIATLVLENLYLPMTGLIHNLDDYNYMRDSNDELILYPYQISAYDRYSQLLGIFIYLDENKFHYDYTRLHLVNRMHRDPLAASEVALRQFYRNMNDYARQYNMQVPEPELAPRFDPYRWTSNEHNYRTIIRPNYADYTISYTDTGTGSGS